MTRLKVATRGSALALRQVEMLRQALEHARPDVELETLVVRTAGDRDQTTSLETIGGQGVFVKDIERLLLAGEAQVAVHSLKDMPADEPAGLTIAAVLPRDDARDVLVSRSGVDLAGLPQGARVGTDSRRRSVQLLAMRPDLRMTSIRGNVDTRVRKVESGEYDAVVLAAAGLERLGLSAQATQVFTVEEVIPAVGQGVIAVQCSKDDRETLEIVQALDDAATRAAITAERAFLKRLGAGCRLPVGAYAEVDGGGSLHMRALLGDDQGAIHRGETTGGSGSAAIAGRTLAERLLMELPRATSAGLGL